MEATPQEQLITEQFAIGLGSTALGELFDEATDPELSASFNASV